MVWMYQRDQQSVTLETRFDADTTSYQLIWRYPDGTSQTEAFPDSASFMVRVQAVEQGLLGTGWALAGPPTVLADGWQTPRKH